MVKEKLIQRKCVFNVICKSLVSRQPHYFSPSTERWQLHQLRKVSHTTQYSLPQVIASKQGLLPFSSLQFQSLLPKYPIHERSLSVHHLHSPARLRQALRCVLHRSSTAFFVPTAPIPPAPTVVASRVRNRNVRQSTYSRVHM